MCVSMMKVKEYLEKKQSFRLGARGISIDFKFCAPGEFWCVSIPRASLNFSYLEVKIWGSTTLALICCDVSIAYIDLIDFLKVSVVE